MFVVVNEPSRCLRVIILWERRRSHLLWWRCRLISFPRKRVRSAPYEHSAELDAGTKDRSMGLTFVDDPASSAICSGGFQIFDPDTTTHFQSRRRSRRKEDEPRLYADKSARNHSRAFLALPHRVLCQRCRSRPLILSLQMNATDRFTIFGDRSYRRIWNEVARCFQPTANERNS